jgi:hypothetical protein
MIAWILAPKSRCLPEYQASIVFPFTLVVVSAQRSVVKTFPSRITCDQPSAATRRRASCRSVRSRSGRGWPRRGSGRRWLARRRTRRRAGSGLRLCGTRRARVERDTSRSEPWSSAGSCRQIMRDWPHIRSSRGVSPERFGYRHIWIHICPAQRYWWAERCSMRTAAS